MALGICAVCGHDDCPIERHHPAGEANFPTVTVAVCRSCHSELGRLQRARGIVLDHAIERTDVERVRALGVGLNDVVRLHVQRHPNPLLPPDVLTLAGRLFSRDLDRLAPPNRPARGLPDATVRIHELPPAERREGGDEDMLVMLMQLGVEALDAVGYTPGDGDPPAELLRRVAADPLGFLARLEATEASRSTTRELMSDLVGVADRLRTLLLFMAAHEPDVEWPAEMLAEARIWGDTMRRILELIVDLAGLSGEVPS